MKRYKLRAECRLDVVELRCALSGGATEWKVTPLTIRNGTGADVAVPDVEVTFASGLTLDALRCACASVADGHVMAETVALANDYTGERRERKEGET